MNNKVYQCKMNEGHGDGAHSTEYSYNDAEIELIGQNTIKISTYRANGSHKNYIKIRKTIFNTTLVAFLFFFSISLGFNLIFYLLVPDTSNLLPPKIILGIFLLVTSIPIIFNLKTINRKVKIEFTAYEFSRVIFKTKSDRDSFLGEYNVLNSGLNRTLRTDEYYANVEYGNISFKNAKLSVVSKHIVGMEVDNLKEEFVFNRKNREIIWFMYIFFGIFLSAPFFLIIPSLINDTFEKGMLATLLLGFVGLIGMFVPTMIAKGKLCLYCDDKKVHLSFCDSKTRNRFNREINKAPAVKNKILSHTVNTYRVDMAKKYEILDENEKLHDYAATIILAIVSLFFLIGIIGIVLTQQEIIGAIVMFVMFSLFSSIGLFISRENIFILKKRLRRKKILKLGHIIIGEITSCTTKLFTFKKHIIYDAELNITYSDEGGRVHTKFIHHKYKDDKQFAVGQKVFLCSHFGTYLAVQCSLLEQDRITSEIEALNKTIYLETLKEDAIDVKLKKQKKRILPSYEVNRPFEKPLKFRDFFAFIGIMPFFILIIYIGVSVIIHNPDDQTQITLAIIVLSTFGTFIGGISGFALVSLIIKIHRHNCEKKFIKHANATYGYITDVDKYVWYVRTNSSNGGNKVPKVRYLINYKFKDDHERIIQKSFAQSDYLYFAKSYYVGEEIIVFYDDNRAIPAKK